MPVEVTLFVRHSPGCKFGDDEFARRCNCRKHLRWSAGGKQYRKAARTRVWAEAEAVKRDIEDQLAGRVAPATAASGQDLGAAIKIFITDKGVQGISKDALARYTRELARLAAYAESARVYTVQGLTRDLLTGYCGTWTRYPSTQTRNIVRARLRSFLRYCYEAKWLDRIPALPKIQVDEPPTLPLTETEVDRLLKGCASLGDVERQRQAHALVLLMRWTGLAVGDALRLPRRGLQLVPDIGKYRVETSRQKTGVHVEVVVPDFVAEELLALPAAWTTAVNGAKHVASRYFFWDGHSDIVNTWTRKVLPKIFDAARIERSGAAGNMTSHRLRDTFACFYLEKGVAIGDVSKMFGHSSIKTTEKSYSAWVKGRQTRLDSVVMGAWEK